MPYLVVFGIAGLVLAIINLHTKCKTLVPPVGMSTKILKNVVILVFTTYISTSAVCLCLDLYVHLSSIHVAV